MEVKVNPAFLVKGKVAEPGANWKNDRKAMLYERLDVVEEGEYDFVIMLKLEFSGDVETVFLRVTWYDFLNASLHETLQWLSAMEENTSIKEITKATKFLLETTQFKFFRETKGGLSGVDRRGQENIGKKLLEALRTGGVPEYGSLRGHTGTPIKTKVRL